MDNFNMDDIQREVTDGVIYTIKNTPELLRRVQTANSIESECTVWAEEHDDMLGEHFISELDMAKWDEVKNAIRQ